MVQVRSFYNRQVLDTEKRTFEGPYAIMQHNLKLMYGSTVALPAMGVAPGDAGNPKRNMLRFDGMVRVVASTKLASGTSIVRTSQAAAAAAATAATPTVHEDATAGLQHKASHATPSMQAASTSASPEQPCVDGNSSSVAVGGAEVASDATVEVAATLAWLKSADALPVDAWDHATTYVVVKEEGP